VNRSQSAAEHRKNAAAHSGIRARASAVQQGMSEKVKQLSLERDYKKYLYFIDGEGNVCQKPKSGEGAIQVLVPHAILRDNQYLYFIDKEGDIARSPRSGRPKAA
jgi:hypothetical protein